MENQVEEVKAKTDIAALIGNYVELKKAGKNFKGLCPFHNEKTPSFVVSPEIQHYKCFGCGESGDVYTFLEKYEGMDFYEALKYLADKAGITLLRSDSGSRGQKDKLYKINSLIAKFYQYILLSHPAGKPALDYLKKRGITASSIQLFKIGFSPDRPLAFGKYLFDKHKIGKKDLLETGVVYNSERGIVDRFRGRIIFPLQDHRDNIIGFAGRIMPETERTLPAGRQVAKYINTPETPIYHKSNVLYGLNVAKSEIKKVGYAVIVEGELDMISSWQAGVKNTVAIKGTALTSEQVKLIARFADGIILALDADSAGSMASRRGIEIAEKEGLNITVAVFDKYKDPDEAARADPDYLMQSIASPIGIWDFLIDLCFKGKKTDSGQDKANISREVVPVLASINDKIVQAHYVSEVAKRMGVTTEAVSEQLSNFGSVVRQEKEKFEGLIQEKKIDRKSLLEERLMGVIFDTSPELVLTKKYQRILSSPFVRRIIEEFIVYKKRALVYNAKEFARQLPAELSEKFMDLILKPSVDLQDDRESSQLEIAVLERELRIIRYKEKMKVLSQKLTETEKIDDRKRSQVLQDKFKKVVKKLSELENTPTKGIILS